MKLKRNIFKLAVSLTFATVLLSPAVVQAFSGFGSGTSAKPFRISTCTQLAEMANDLSGYYVLNNNIDCNNATFSSISSNFTGTLDGQNHTIKNINFSQCGIFCTVSGGTVENITVAGGTLTSTAYGSSIGTFAGKADDGTFNNLHSNLTITGSSGDQYVGGIAGLVFQGANSITNSSYTGSITVPGSDGYVGGIAGVTYGVSGASYSLSNDYAAATITLTSGSSYQSAGGLIGGHFAGSITNSYSAGSISSASSSYNNVGGFAGIFGSGATIQDSFSATAVSGIAATIGAVYGSSGGTNTNMYFDQTRAGEGSACSGDSTTTCTAVNASGDQSSYFFNNSSNVPLNSWNFNSVWQVGSSYPTLRNEAAFVIPGTIPNNGDANGDGKQDAYQPNVADIEDTAGAWTTVTVPSSSNCIVGDGSSTSYASLKAYSGYAALNNPANFNVYCLTTGATVPITIIYDRVYISPTLVFYNSSTQTYTKVSGAQFSTVTIGGVARTEVTYNATDGGAYDSDGTANGIIADPVGLMTPTASVSSPNTGYGSPASRDPIILLIAFGAIISTGAGLLRLHYSKTKA